MRKKFIKNLFIFSCFCLTLVTAGCQKNDEISTESVEITGEYTEIEMENEYLISNDPAKLGLQINSDGKLQDFVIDSKSCGTPFYIQKMTWNGNSCEWKKLDFMDENDFLIKILTDDNANYFLLYPDFLIVYSPSGDEVSRINVDADYDSEMYIEGDNVYLILSEEKMQVFNFNTGRLVEEYEISNLSNILLFDNYILSKNESNLIVSDINGIMVNTIPLPDGDPVYKFTSEYGDWFIYNKELICLKDKIIYYSCIDGIYEADINGNEFNL